MDILLQAFLGDRSPGIYRLDPALAGDLDVDLLAIACEGRNLRFYYLDGNIIHSKTEFLQTASKVIEFPDYFGQNWDAFEECIQDFGNGTERGFVLLYDMPDFFIDEDETEWAIALDVLQDAVDYWQDTDSPLYVLFKSQHPELDTLNLLGD